MKNESGFKILLPILSILLFISGCASTGPKIAEYANPQKVLVVMDMQNDFLSAKARMPIKKSQIPGLIQVVNSLIERNLAEGNQIIYIRNVFSKNDIGNVFRNNAAVEGNLGIQIDERVKVLSATIFDKKEPDAFSNKAFEEFLIKNQVSQIEICGVFADQCVFYTSQAALNRGYTVYYVKNGVASSSEGTTRRAIDQIQKAGAIVVTN